MRPEEKERRARRSQRQDQEKKRGDPERAKDQDRDKDSKRNRVNLQPSVSQRRMKSLTGGYSAAQTFTTMRMIILDYPQIPDEEHHPILREDVEAAVKAAWITYQQN